MKRRRLWCFMGVAVAAVLSAFPGIVRAQAYPTKPLRLVVGYAPGGGQDQVGRLLAQGLGERLGQQVLVENRPGSSTMVATEAVVQAPPDGYTLLLVSPATIMAPGLQPKLRYDLKSDIAPVWGVIRETSVLVVPAEFPVTSLDELVTYAKANPGKINMASSGVGGTAHVAGEMFKQRTGIDMLHVPYRGTAPALIDVIAGRAQVSFSSLPGAIGHIRQGKLKALGVTTTKRSPTLPDVPAVAEQYAGFEASGMVGVGAPRGTPAEIIERLNRELGAVAATPVAQARWKDLGSVDSHLPPGEFGRYMAGEIDRWSDVIRAAGIKPE